MNVLVLSEPSLAVPYWVPVHPCKGKWIREALGHGIHSSDIARLKRCGRIEVELALQSFRP